MFTGIIEEVGTVTTAPQGRLAVAARRVLDGSVPGDSIAVNGACLTVVDISQGGFAVDVMPETLRRTNLGLLRPGDGVNLERALAVGGRMGGHFVQGHVDGTGRVMSVSPEGEALVARFEAPPEVMGYVVSKGFIAVDGVSLTVVECSSHYFTVSLVGYTLGNTTLGGKRAGDVVNLEVDIIAKYVERLHGGGSRVTMEFLAEHGFL
ncbi:MAG: riboflavin synthase [Chloroflexota bacterium]|nr:riboflavin synthase [Chloroflexota bacterium]